MKTVLKAILNRKTKFHADTSGPINVILEVSTEEMTMTSLIKWIKIIEFDIEIMNFP